MKKYYSAVKLGGLIPVLLPEEVTPISFFSHITMANFEAEIIPNIEVAGEVTFKKDLYILQGHYTKQTMIVCPVVINDSFKTIKSAFPDDNSPYDRFYHMTVGTLPYNPELENLSLYEKNDGIFTMDVIGAIVEEFAPKKY